MAVIPKPTYYYLGRVVRVVDGDTLDISVDLGFSVSIVERLRVAHIDTPELRSPVPDQRVAAKASWDMAMKLLPVGELVGVHSYKSGNEKYGRWLASITLPDGRDFGSVMVELGHAVSYEGKIKEG